MARTTGARNADYDEKRKRLAASFVPHIAAGGPTTLRELADAAGVSVSTIRHYFGDAEGAVEAALAAMSELGRPHMEHATRAERGGLAESMEWFVAQLVMAFRRFGVGPMHASALGVGIGNPRLGPAYVTEILEPTLQTAEARLAMHAARGELASDTDVRHAALSLVSPIVLALLHQDALGGDRCRPLDVDAFVAEHVRRFVFAYGAEANP